MNDLELIATAERNLHDLYQKNAGFAEFIRNSDGFIGLMSWREIPSSTWTDPCLRLSIDCAGSVKLIFRNSVGLALMQTTIDYSWEELGRKFDKKYQEAFRKVIKKLAGSEEDIIKFFERRRFGRKIKGRAIIIIQEPEMIKGTELAIVAVKREGAKYKVDPHTDPSLQRDLSILSAIVPAGSIFKIGQKVKLHYFEHEGEILHSISAIPDNR